MGVKPRQYGECIPKCRLTPAGGYHCPLFRWIQDLTVQALVIFFIELCALRRAPQDLPPSEVLFGLALLADLLAGMLVGLVTGLSWWEGLGQGFAEIALMLAVLYAALNLLKRGARFLQAATALLGSGALLGLIALLPLSLNPVGQEVTNLAAFGALLLLGLVVWSILVTGHILRHTFGITLGQGAAIGIAFEFTTIVLVRVLFGGV